MHYRFRFAAIVTISLCLPACRGIFHPSRGAVEEAEEFARDERYDEAIQRYREHIERRLKVRDRPEWENPYVYLLSIGDLQLKFDKPKEALESYEEAERMHIDPRLIADRYRLVARYFEEQGKLEASIDVLTRYRDRDPLLFDGMLDRISKRIVQQEELGAATPFPR